jgi:uncharacterized protein YfaS (alpha-2-macroglobulin family)
MIAKRAIVLLTWLWIVGAAVLQAQPTKKYEVGAFVLSGNMQADKIDILIRTLNLTQVDCALYEITPAQYEKYAKRVLPYGNTINTHWLKSRGMPEPRGTLKKKWRVSFDPRSGVKLFNARHNIGYTRTITLPKIPLGVYYLKVSSKGISCGILLPVSHLASIVKVTPKELWVCVSNVKTGNPVSGVPLQIYDDKNNRVERRVDESSGLVRLELKGLNFPISLYGVYGKQVLFSRIFSPFMTEKERWKPYLYTERPIYRPGQEVHFKVVLREIVGQEYRNAPHQALTLSIRDSRARTIYRKEVATNAMGSYSGTFTLNKEASVGYYFIHVELEGQSHRRRFEVAAYRKPEFEITVSSPRPHYIGDTRATFDLQASYFFGMPVPHARIRYTIQRYPKYDDYDNPYAESDDTILWDDEFLYLYPSGKTVASGTATTDASGKARVQFRTRPERLNDSFYRMHVTVQDASGRTETGTGEIIGLRSELLLQAEVQPFFVGKNQPFTLNVTAHDLGKRGVAVPLMIELIRWKWTNKKDEDDSKAVKTWRERTDAQGEAKIQLSHDSEGMYRVRVTAADSQGRKTVTEAWINIRGNRSLASAGDDSQSLRVLPERNGYQPGDTARILIQVSKPPTKVWLTLETDHIHDSRLLTVDNPGGTVVEVPILPEYKPGVYLSVVNLKSPDLRQAPFYIRVPFDDKQLKVQIEPDKPEYRPGERARFTVRTLDSTGHPAPAELSLGLVDSALYTIKPDTVLDPFRYFWGKRACYVSTFIGLPFSSTLGLGMGGGARGYLAGSPQAVGYALKRQRGPSYLRARFEDLAYWHAHIQTDAQGHASVELDMPDNLTRWQATVRALTEDTKAGQATEMTLVRQPVMARLMLPRFTVQGDKAPFRVMLSNRTSQRQNLTVRLTAHAEGSTTMPVEETRRVQLEANGQVTLNWLPYPSIPAAQSLRLRVYAYGEGSHHPDTEDAVEQTVTVLPRALMQRTVKSGEWQGEHSLLLKLPPGADPRHGKLTVRVYASPVARAIPALEYLRFYPYGCTEQTSSGLIGLAHAKRLAQQLQLESPGWLKGADEQVQTGSMRLYNLQITGGGWGWWGGEYNTDPMLTAYALIALAELKDAGWEVDREAVYYGVREAEAILQSGKSRTGRGLAPTGERRRTLNTTERAWLVYALSMHRKSIETAAQVLYKNRTKLNALELSLLGLALTSDRNKRGQVGAIVQLLERKNHRDPHGVYWKTNAQDWFTSEYEGSAYALRLLLMHAPHHPLVQPALERLLIHNEMGAFCTKDSAQLLAALTVYTQKFKPVTTGAEVTLQLDGSAAVHLRTPVLNDPVPFVQYEIPASELAGSGKRLTFHSQERLSFSTELQYYLPLKTPAGSRNNARASGRMQVSRAYYAKDHQGKWIPLKRAVKAGETIQVRVKVTTPDIRDYLLVEDPFPSGFEYASSPSGAVLSRSHHYLGYEHSQPSDTHLAVFIYRMNKSHEFVYYLRAEAHGVRTALPTRVEQMYRPQERTSGTHAVLQVND